MMRDTPLPLRSSVKASAELKGRKVECDADLGADTA